MRSILLYVNDDEGLESRLAAALAVAHQQRGHLSGIQVTPVSDYVATDPFGGVHAVTMLFEHLAEQAAEARAKVEARIAKRASNVTGRSVMTVSPHQLSADLSLPI